MDSTKGEKESIIREDIKLHESEIPWRPIRFYKFISGEDREYFELYRKVRGILNKLTPQKFDTLSNQIKSLSIDSCTKLQGVIDLIFEKAVNEPFFSVMYASMCGQLALIQVPTNTCTEKFVNFRKLIITRCQYEFENQSIDENFRNQKMKEIDACTDLDRKKDLEFELSEYFRNLRLKSVGNIKFIGELFKQNMLSQSIMLRCLNILLKNKDEESLECLCTLLTTVGKDLESKHVDLGQIFDEMKQLADNNESVKISNRIRFMLQDVIDLRNSKWVSRRHGWNPTTLDQIQKDDEQELHRTDTYRTVPLYWRKVKPASETPITSANVDNIEADTTSEPFKQNMLAKNTMLKCLQILLKNKDEESLECFCTLLTTVGKDLESKHVDLGQIFDEMKQLADNNESDKISNRIRFMLQYVINLRNSKWVHRRQASNSKTLDQIQKDAEQELINIQMMNFVPITTRKDDSRGEDGGSQRSMNDRKSCRGRNIIDENWRTSKFKPDFSVYSNKLKTRKASQPDEPFLDWRKVKLASETSITSSNVDNIEADTTASE